MKFLVFAVFGIVLYLILDLVFKKLGYKKFRKWLAPAIFISLVLIFMTGAFLSSKQGDIQCGRSHKVNYLPPSIVKSAQDYFDLGNYQYDLGNCRQAVKEYDQAIKLNPNFAQAYNNRAYTYMRLREYSKSLPDLDKAIELRPDYVFALMNRGDIYNYYYNVDRIRAIEDYDKVSTLVKDNRKRRELSLCGHKLIAQNGGWSPKVYLQLLTQGLFAGCN